jgi:hypothetical protein
MNRDFPMMVLPPEPPMKGSRLYGYDREQYAFNAAGVPQAVVDAVHTGFGIILSDFDCRQIDWGL